MGFDRDKMITLGLTGDVGDDRKVATLPLLKLISSLNAAQFWTLLVAASGLIGGSFVIGYSFRSETAQAQSAGDKYQIERLKEQHNRDIEDKRVLSKEVELLTLQGRVNQK